MRVINNRVLFLIFLLFFSFSIVLTGVCPTKYVRADNLSSKFDETNVLDDLKDMTLDGEKFSLEEYNFDTSKKTQLLSFVEFCYSFYEEKQDDFGFYVYIYNPKGLKFKTESELNKIQMSYTNSDNVYSDLYRLKFLNMSDKADYEGLFYKFKVVLSDFQKTDILSKVNSANRVYSVVSIHLHEIGETNADVFPVSSTFTYSGYSKGYGPNEDADSTLRFTSESLETLSLDVFPTVYRPEFTNGKNEYTRDSLHSVYFAVPNKYLEHYGDLVEVHATWRDAVLKPVLVTGNKDAYNSISVFLGQDVTSLSSSNLPYSYLSNPIFGSGTGFNLASCSDYFGHLKDSTVDGYYLLYDYLLKPQKVLNFLYFMFDASTYSSAGDFIVSSSMIQEKLLESVNKFGGNLVNSKYSEYVFESVSENFENKQVRAYETHDLRNIDIDKSWWDKLWGNEGEKNDYSDAFNGIKAIYPVNSNDLNGSIKEVSDRLFISQSDVVLFRDFYNKNKQDSTVFLFRYQVSDYISKQATLVKEGKDLLGVTSLEVVDTNAYFFQETINLDFSIIDVTLSTGEVETVIPVVSSPIDVIGGGEPPVYWEDENTGSKNLLKIILGLILLIILLVVLMPILPSVISFIINILLLPFRLLNKLFKKNKSG